MDLAWIWLGFRSVLRPKLGGVSWKIGSIFGGVSTSNSGNFWGFLEDFRRGFWMALVWFLGSFFGGKTW